MRRSLHLVDIENLVCGCYAPSQMVLQQYRTYLEVAAWQHQDQVVVASSRLVGQAVTFGIHATVPCSYTLVRPGPDAADRVLIDTGRYMIARVGRLVVGSGDGLFTDLADQAREAGLRVKVVGVDGHISAALTGAADSAVALPDPVDRWFE